MTELELRQMFKNLSNCYADTGRFENDGSYTEGEVIQAMTEDRFIEALKEAKLLPIPAVVGQSEQLKAFKQAETLLLDNTLKVEVINPESKVLVKDSRDNKLMWVERNRLKRK